MRFFSFHEKQLYSYLFAYKTRNMYKAFAKHRPVEGKSPARAATATSVVVVVDATLSPAPEFLDDDDRR